jgi:hypothetical protein
VAHDPARDVANRRGRLVDAGLHEGIGSVSLRIHHMIACLRGDDVARRTVQREIDRGQQAAVRPGAGDEPSLDTANVGLVRVPAHHEIHRAVETLHDRHDGAVEIGAAFLAGRRRRAPALVDQQDDRLDALGAQLGHERVDAGRLVAELQAAHARGGHDLRRAAQHGARRRPRERPGYSRIA